MSTADKRSPHTDALDTLGTGPLDESAARDAIHLAVEPVIAAEQLLPGMDVGFTDDRRVAHRGVAHVGIVDPFLKAPVQPGQRFWLVVYPRQITSLRHVWTHPEIPEGEAAPVPPSKEDSEKWLRQCLGLEGSEYDDDYITTLSNIYPGQEWLTVFGNDASGNIPPEFWTHVEIVTGRKIAPEDRPTYFSCSC